MENVVLAKNVSTRPPKPPFQRQQVGTQSGNSRAQLSLSPLFTIETRQSTAVETAMPIRPSYWPQRGQPERTEPFTWIVEGVIAASWWPDPYVFDIFEEKGIKAVVNVCEFDNRQDVPEQFDYHFIHVPDFGVPSDSQIEQFLKLMDDHHAANRPVVVHCVAGCGRTGQFIIAWCAKAGFIPKGTNPVEWIRARRKCCLETGGQIQCAQRLMKKFSK